jgi:hypothetical protein
MIPVRELIYRDEEYFSFIDLFAKLKEDKISSKEKVVELLTLMGFTQDMAEFAYLKYRNFLI